MRCYRANMKRHEHEVSLGTKMTLGKLQYFEEAAVAALLLLQLSQG
jgi:hypothetical protein